jgi:hypothetical protein
MRRLMVASGEARTGLRHLQRVAATVVAMLVMAGVGGCAGSDQTTGAGGDATTTTATSTPGSTVTTTAAGATRPEPAVLDDGRHPVFLKTVDPERRRITFDLVQFYTGAAAVKAATEDNQESPPPNDYYIRNTNPRLRTLPVRSAAPVTVNVLAAEQTGSSTKDVPVTLTKLASWFPNPSNPTFWITVRDGEVTRIAQQYLP